MQEITPPYRWVSGSAFEVSVKTMELKTRCPPPMNKNMEENQEIWAGRRGLELPAPIPIMSGTIKASR
jgi:hypothetical protein